MITEIQGVPPIIITRFEELQAKIKRNKEEVVELPGEETSYNPNSQEVNFAQQSNNDANKRKINFDEIGKKLSSLLEQDNVSIEFSLDKETKKMIMKIINNSTQELIQQIPPEIALKIARIVASTIEQGLVADAKV